MTLLYMARAAMLDLLMTAYRVDLDQVVGPPWISEFNGPNLYEVIATMPVDTTKEQFAAMMRTLLKERFHLAVHHETRNFPGYNLVVAKGGPKLKAVTHDANADAYTGPRHRGLYDFTLQFSCAGCLGMGGAALGNMPLVAQRARENSSVTNPASIPASDPGSGLPNIFTALEKQLD